MPSSASTVVSTGNIIPSLLNESGQDVVRIGRPTTLTAMVANLSGRPIVLKRSTSEPVPTITLDFSALGDGLSLDSAAVNAQGFRLTASTETSAELTLVIKEFVWAPGNRIAISVPSITVGGSAGMFAVGLTLANAGPAVDGRYAMPLVVVGQPLLSTVERGVGASPVSVKVNSLTASPNAFQNLSAPGQAMLSWTTTNATMATLSGVGVVETNQINLPVQVEQTTTFVLTAYDASMAQMASQSVTVTVTPTLAARLVPSRTIMLWSGDEGSVPPGWVVCDGQNNTPDLSGLFVIGAGDTIPPNSKDSKGDSHSHPIPAKSVSFQTTDDGQHSHAMPSFWYNRGLSSGGCTGIDRNAQDITTTKTQEAGKHHHSGTVTFPDSATEPVTGVRPPWYALFYIMKV